MNYMKYMNFESKVIWILSNKFQVRYFSFLAEKYDFFRITIKIFMIKMLPRFQVIFFHYKKAMTFRRCAVLITIKIGSKLPSRHGFARPRNFPKDVIPLNKRSTELNLVTVPVITFLFR